MDQITLRQTAAFSKQLQKLGSEIHFQQLAGRLKAHPELGDVIPGTNGLRKVRMALLGRGSRGGARIIYIWLKNANEILFLWIFTKGEAEDLNPKEKRALSDLARAFKSEHQNAKKEKKRRDQA